LEDNTAETTSVETKGFKWNIGANEEVKTLDWNGIISTSNEILEHEVFIKSDVPLVFSTTLNYEESE
jgi:thiamine pyrophosphokinase